MAPKNPGGNAGKGRPRGSPNKATAAIRELAGRYTQEALAALVAVMGDPKAPPAARVSAAVAILDRAHGKPTQPLAGDDSMDPIRVADTREANLALLAALRRRLAGGDPGEPAAGSGGA